MQRQTETRQFREDMEANLRLAEALAPTHCAGCNGYHLARARRRVQTASPEALDRGQTMALVADCFDRSAGERFDILIAGAGDTNLLATGAEAVAGAARARYTVLDRCGTPLALCQAFAERHGLDVSTHQVDLTAPSQSFRADLIVVHSLLRFLPQPTHLDIMRTLQAWLKPGGAMVFSHRLIPDGTATETCYQAEYPSTAPILALLAEAGLRVAWSDEPVESDGPRHRFLALLEAA